MQKENTKYKYIWECLCLYMCLNLFTSSLVKIISIASPTFHLFSLPNFSLSLVLGKRHVTCTYSAQTFGGIYAIVTSAEVDRNAPKCPPYMTARDICNCPVQEDQNITKKHIYTKRPLDLAECPYKDRGTLSPKHRDRDEGLFNKVKSIKS